MAIRFSFFSTPEHKVFHYEPLYYDERKERLEKLYEKYGKNPDGTPVNAEIAEAEAELRAAENKRYIPGMSIRGAYRRSLEENRKEEGNRKMKKILTLVTILVVMVAAYYLAEGFADLIAKLR